MSNQSAKHASLQAKLGASGLTYERAFHAYWDFLGTITAKNFDERMLQWLNIALSASHTNLPAAQQAYAVSKGAYNWDSLGDLQLP
jgi:hypothetical protein